MRRNTLSKKLIEISKIHQIKQLHLKIVLGFLALLVNANNKKIKVYRFRINSQWIAFKEKLYKICINRMSLKISFKKTKI